MPRFTRSGGRRRIRPAGMTMLLSGALLACGCGGPEGSGTIDMGKAKEAAAARGIPEKQATPAAAPKASGRRGGVAPNQPIPKGSR